MSMRYSKEDVEAVLAKARAINSRISGRRRHVSLEKAHNNPAKVMEQVEVVLAKARAINDRVSTRPRHAPKYEVPAQRTKILAQSTNSEELEEFELLFTKKANFKKLY